MSRSFLFQVNSSYRKDNIGGVNLLGADRFLSKKGLQSSTVVDALCTPDGVFTSKTVILYEDLNDTEVSLFWNTPRAFHGFVRLKNVHRRTAEAPSFWSFGLHFSNLFLCRKSMVLRFAFFKPISLWEKAPTSWYFAARDLFGFRKERNRSLGDHGSTLVV